MHDIGRYYAPGWPRCVKDTNYDAVQALGSCRRSLGGARAEQCDNDNRNQYKYVYITTYEPGTKSNPNPILIPNIVNTIFD